MGMAILKLIYDIDINETLLLLPMDLAASELRAQYYSIKHHVFHLQIQHQGVWISLQIIRPCAIIIMYSVTTTMLKFLMYSKTKLNWL
jgi:hypothetical protein